jgi:hypothetical protein
MSEGVFKTGLLIVCLLLLILPIVISEIVRKQSKDEQLSQFNDFYREFRKGGQRDQLQRDTWLQYSKVHGKWPMESIGLTDTSVVYLELRAIERDLDKQSMMKYGYYLLPPAEVKKIIVRTDDWTIEE